MMDRRAFLIGGSAAFLVPALAGFSRAALAQTRVHRIAWLYPLRREAARVWNEAFLAGMKDAGYVESRDFQVEYRFSDGEDERLPKLATELVATNPEVILTHSPAAAVALRKATASIPIVVASAADPLAYGLVKSLAHPGENVTGLASFTVEVAGKRLLLLKEAFPTVRRICVWSSSTSPNATPEEREVHRAAAGLGVETRSFSARTAQDYATIAQGTKQWGADAIYVAANAISQSNRGLIVSAIAQLRIPAVYWNSDFVQEGGLMSYGTDFSDLSYRSASYAVQILKGAKPGDLPFEQPNRLELVFNLKTAKALDISIAEAVLLRADKVIR
jgi:putative ABC transport system substrate-binding protein